MADRIIDAGPGQRLLIRAGSAGVTVLVDDDGAVTIDAKRIEIGNSRSIVAFHGSKGSPRIVLDDRATLDDVIGALEVIGLVARRSMPAPVPPEEATAYLEARAGKRKGKKR